MFPGVYFRFFLMVYFCDPVHLRGKMGATTPHFPPSSVQLSACNSQVKIRNCFLSGLISTRRCLSSDRRKHFFKVCVADSWSILVHTPLNVLVS